MPIWLQALWTWLKTITCTIGRGLRLIWRGLKDIDAAAHKLQREDLHRSVRAGVAVAMLLAVLLLFGAGRVAGQVVPAEHPFWEAVLQAKLVLVRTVLANLPLIQGLLVAYLAYQVYENTELGRRTVIWHLDECGAPDERVEIRAAKTRNAGLIQAALVAGCVLGYLQGVLR